MCDGALYASPGASLAHLFDSSFSQVPSAHPFDNGEFAQHHPLSPSSIDSAATFASQLSEHSGIEGGAVRDVDASFSQRQSASSTTAAAPSSSYMAQHVPPPTPSYEHVGGDYSEPFSNYRLAHFQPLRALTVPPQFYDFSQSTQSPVQSPDPITFAPEAFHHPVSPGAHPFFNNNRYALLQHSPSFPKLDYAQFPHLNPNLSPSAYSTAVRTSNAHSATDSGGVLDYRSPYGLGADHDDPRPARGGVTTEIVPTHVSKHREDVVPPQDVFAQSRRVSDVSIRSADSNYMSSVSVHSVCPRSSTGLTRPFTLQSPSTSSYIPSPSHTFTSPLPSPCATSPVISTTSYVPVTYNNTSSNPSSTSTSAPLSLPPSADPYVAAYLRERLGETKFTLFTSRLFERRFGSDQRGRNGTGSRKRGSVSSVEGPPSSADGDGDMKPMGEPGTNAVEFLVKVEIVKEILRSYVP